MTRPLLRLMVVLAALCGAALGAFGALVLTEPSQALTATAPANDAGGHDRGAHDPGGRDLDADDRSDHQPVPPAPVPQPPSAADPPTTAAPPPTPGPSSAPSRVLLAWTAGGLPGSIVDAASGDPAISAWSAVAGDQVGLVAVHAADGEVVLSLADGWQVPLDVLALDPTAHAPFLADLGAPGDTAVLADLTPGSALLSATAAALRGVGTGAVLTLDAGEEVVVAGVIADGAASGAELVVHAEDAVRLGVDTPRFLLLAHTGARSAVQQRLADAVGTRPVRFRTPAETTWLRHGDAVLPQAQLKAAYGEFAIRLVAGRDVAVDPVWEAATIRTATIPILGEVRCHRLLLPRLDAAMAALARRNLGHLVDAAAFAGCYVPRRIAPDQPLSRHAWGLAVDLNVGDNPRGSFSTQDPRLVEVMREHGFTWGGTWLVPDPAHYEVVTTEDW